MKEYLMMAKTVRGLGSGGLVQQLWTQVTSWVTSNQAVWYGVIAVAALGGTIFFAMKHKTKEAAISFGVGVVVALLLALLLAMMSGGASGGAAAY